MKKSYVWGIIFVLAVVIIIIISFLLKGQKFSANEIFEGIDWNTQTISFEIDKYGTNGFTKITVSDTEKEQLVEALKSAKFKKTSEPVGSKDVYTVTLKTNKPFTFFINTEKGLIVTFYMEKDTTYEFENNEFIDLLLKLNQ